MADDDPVNLWHRADGPEGQVGMTLALSIMLLICFFIDNSKRRSDLRSVGTIINSEFMESAPSCCPPGTPGAEEVTSEGDLIEASVRAT